jgi:uncharacterized membrane protein
MNGPEGILLSFFAYAVLGWLHELVYGVVIERRLRNPGFLYAPMLPIYGIGALAISALLVPVGKDPVAVFLGGVLITSTVEYLGHVLLERAGVQLWDYSSRRFNLNGRICLGNSLGFGVLALLVIYVIDPALSTGVARLDPSVATAATVIGVSVLLVDLVVSISRRDRRTRASIDLRVRGLRSREADRSKLAAPGSAA